MFLRYRKIFIICLIVLLIPILFLIYNNQYKWNANSSEYALYKVYTAIICGDTRIVDYYTSNNFYKYFSEESIYLTPKNIKEICLGMVKKNQGYEISEEIQKKIDYAFSHIIKISTQNNTRVSMEENSILILQKPKLGKDIVDYGILEYAKKDKIILERSFTLKKEDNIWKIVTAGSLEREIDETKDPFIERVSREMQGIEAPKITTDRPYLDYIEFPILKQK